MSVRDVLLVLVKVLTVLTVLFCLGLAVWSFVTAKPLVLGVAALGIAAIGSVFVYRDVKAALDKTSM